MQVMRIYRWTENAKVKRCKSSKFSRQKKCKDEDMAFNVGQEMQKKNRRMQVICI